MKGFLDWFKSSTKMKRWIFLILVGIMLSCIGIVRIMVMNEITLIGAAKVVAIFVFGFTCVILGLIFCQKRTLEVLIEATDSRMDNKKNVNVNSLIFNKKVYSEGPNIVVIGGGSGLNTVIQGLKKYTNNITSIVTVSDYGEIATRSRDELKTLHLNDIKNSIVALSKNEEEMNTLMNYEFRQGRLEGLSFGDIYLSAMNNTHKDLGAAVKETSKVLNIIGKVIPVTLDEINICAELANGTVVNERSKIADMVSDQITKINRIYITPSNSRPAPGVIEAIENADSIIIGPGSLYTNVIPNLLVNGVAKAIKDSKAIKVYVSNIMTEPGQTDDYSVTDHVNAIVEHAGKGIIDYCLYDTGEVIPEYIKKYNREGAELVEQKLQGVKNLGIQLLQRDLAIIINDYVRHDSDAVARAVIELVCDDLKFKDKQNDPQYVMMNRKLKEDKRINKLKKKSKAKKVKAKDKKTKNKRKSKFSNKYSERIESIKSSDEHTRKRREAAKKEIIRERLQERAQDIKSEEELEKERLRAKIREEMRRKLQ